MFVQLLHMQCKKIEEYLANPAAAQAAQAEVLAKPGHPVTSRHPQSHQGSGLQAAAVAAAESAARAQAEAAAAAAAAAATAAADREQIAEVAQSSGLDPAWLANPLSVELFASNAALDSFRNDPRMAPDQVREREGRAGRAGVDRGRGSGRAGQGRQRQIADGRPRGQAGGRREEQAANVTVHLLLTTRVVVAMSANCDANRFTDRRLSGGGIRGGTRFSRAGRRQWIAIHR